MAQDGNRVTAWIQGQVRSAHAFLEATMGDVTEEIAHWGPPGLALPIAAAYAHFVMSEDWLVNVLFRGGAPLFAGPHAGRTGVSELPPDPSSAKDWCGEISALKGVQGKKEYPF
jgi:hypothetical protein